MILGLKDEFLLEKEEDMARFLGIQIVHDPKNNTITMTQTGLIDKVLASTDMEDCNLKYTPAEKDPLCKDAAGAPCCDA